MVYGMATPGMGRTHIGAMPGTDATMPQGAIICSSSSSKVGSSSSSRDASERIST
jgi:hypothetical protein